MSASLWPLHPQLLDSSRSAALTRYADRAGLVDMAILLTAGSGAALAVACLDLHLRVPGHAILRAMLPMALGLSLAPRRLGGLVMGCGAYSTTLLLRFAGGPTPGIGAFTSLCLLGPMLDLVLWHARGGWRLYARFALAGCLANLAAFAVRGGGKWAGLDAWHARSLADWATVAPWTYSLCGLVAGLVCAAVWFRLRTVEAGTDAAAPKLDF